MKTALGCGAAATREACCVACTATARCTAAVYDPAGAPGQTCWLKFGAGTRVPKAGVALCEPQWAGGAQRARVLNICYHPHRTRPCDCSS